MGENQEGLTCNISQRGKMAKLMVSLLFLVGTFVLLTATDYHVFLPVGLHTHWRSLFPELTSLTGCHLTLMDLSCQKGDNLRLHPYKDIFDIHHYFKCKKKNMLKWKLNYLII